MKFDLLDHGYLELVETWGSDQSIIEAARMSTDKGFLGWGVPAHYVVVIKQAGFTYWLRFNPDGSERLPGFAITTEEQHARRFDSTEQAAEMMAAYRERSPASECHIESRAATPGDEKLLAYLWKHEHATPFEMAGITIEVKAPIMVFREWHRHRVPFGYNEMSARYVPLPDENYVPGFDDLIERSQKAATTANRQASGTGKVMNELDAMAWLDQLAQAYQHAEGVYQLGLRLGVPKELARLPVPVGRYSRMRATANLRGWLGFMKLRAAPTAQKEIRVYAEALGEIIREKFPRTHALYAGGT